MLFRGLRHATWSAKCLVILQRQYGMDVDIARIYTRQLLLTPEMDGWIRDGVPPDGAAHLIFRCYCDGAVDISNEGLERHYGGPPPWMQ